MYRSRLHRGGGLLALLLTALTLTLTLSGPGTARAQDSSDICDPSEPVACIPIPEQPVEPGANTPSIGAPIPPVPGPCTPIAVQAPSAGTGIAVPLPPGCPVGDVITTMNRANLLWARAVRTLDPSVLDEVWAGAARQSVRDYVAQLRAAGQYLAPELRAITLTGIQNNGRRARLTTVETWYMELRWWPSGPVILADRQRVANLYELEWGQSGWKVVRNEVHPVDNQLPLPPLPPGPPSPPCIAIFPPPPGCEGSESPASSVTVTADKEIYLPGETVVATVTNTGNTVLAGGSGYGCGLVEVGYAPGGGDMYTPAPGGAEVCPAIAILLKPGESRTETFTFTELGQYRLIVRMSVEGSPTGQTVVASDPFMVVVT